MHTPAQQRYRFTASYYEPRAVYVDGVKVNSVLISTAAGRRMEPHLLLSYRND